MNRSVALETSRGWRIAKEKQSPKIDGVVALAQAALGAMKGGTSSLDWYFAYIDRENKNYAALMGAPAGFMGVVSAKCAKCGRPLPPGSVIFQARGLKFCSQDCAW